MKEVVNITIKINSYQTRNIILSDDEHVFKGTSKAKNFERFPILERVGNFLDAAYSEANDRYNLHVTGNVFEQLLLKTEAGFRAEVLECTTGFSEINWSSLERLLCLQKFLRISPDVCEIPVSLVGEVKIPLPEYPLVRFVESPSAPKLIVSQDIYTIQDFLEDSNCEPVVFWVGGESRRTSKSGPLIIGCSPDEVQSLVASYLECRYVNPFIGELYARNKTLCGTQSDPRFRLVDKTEPYFYADKESNQITLFPEDAFEVGIHSITADEYGNLRIDDAVDLQRLRVEVLDRKCEQGIEMRVATIKRSDCRKGRALNPGTVVFGFYREDGSKVFEFTVVVKEHQYITTLKTTILEAGQRVSRWCIGCTYEIFTTAHPHNAEDMDSITYTTNKPKIARVEGNQITILQEGEFILTTKSLKATERNTYVVKNAIVKSIEVYGWPKGDSIVVGKSFTAKPVVSPETANWRGCKYEIVKGGKCVTVSGSADTGLRIHAKRTGRVSVKFISNDDPDVCCTKDLVVLHGPPKPRLLAYLGVVFSVLSIFSVGTTDEHLFWAFLLAAAVCYVIGAVRREKHVVVIAALSFLVCVLFYSSWGNAAQSAQSESTSPSETTHQQETEPIDTNMLHTSDLETIKAEAAEMVGSSLYSGELLQDDGSWTPVTVEYSGYFVRDVTIVTSADCNVDLIFKVRLANPSSTTSHILYAVVQYEANYNDMEGLYYLRTDTSEPEWYAAIEDWFASIDRGDFYETSFSVEEMGTMHGWDEYLNDRAIITAADAEELMNRGHDILSDKYEDITFDSACLYVSNDKFSPTRNELYLYFKQEQEYEGGTCVTYYFPLHASNIKVTTDSSGNAKLDLDSVVFTQEDYLTELPKNRGWVPLNWTENTTE